MSIFKHIKHFQILLSMYYLHKQMAADTYLHP